MTLNTTNNEANFVALGAADTFYRVILSTLGSYMVNNLTLCYIFSSFVGMLLSIICANQTNSAFTSMFCLSKI